MHYDLSYLRIRSGTSVKEEKEEQQEKKEKQKEKTEKEEKISTFIMIVTKRNS